MMNTKHHKTREWNPLEANHFTLKVSGYFFSKQAAKDQTRKILRNMALKFGVKIYSCAVNGNHIHLLLKATTRKDLTSFLRAASGSLAKTFRKLLNLPKNLKFWLNRPWSRTVTMKKRGFQEMQNYVAINYLESLGRARKYISKTDIAMVLKNGCLKLFSSTEWKQFSVDPRQQSLF